MGTSFTTNGTPVPSKTLTTDSGVTVLNGSGDPMVAPQTYDPKTFAENVVAAANSNYTGTFGALGLR